MLCNLFQVFNSSVLQISKIDACMMKTITTLQQLECKIDAVTVLDYRWILVPLIKLHMRVGIEPVDLLAPSTLRSRVYYIFIYCFPDTLGGSG